MEMIKTYRQLIHLSTFEERFRFLKLGGLIGQQTFGFDRYLNQTLYQSREWKACRRDMIIRDKGCDLAIEDRQIFSNLTLHHIVPITINDLELGKECVFDPNNLVCTSHNTHNAIHYGDESLLIKLPTERRKGDTSLWTASSHPLRNF